MKTQISLRILLALHIAGLVVMAGTTLIDYFTFKIFWKFADQGDSRSLGLLPLMAKYGGLVRTGAVIIIFTGIAMFLLSKGIWWQQSRFKIKMALVLLLVLNGMFIGNTQGSKFRKIIAANIIDFIQHSTGIRETLNSFYLIQLAIFFLIILASVIRY